MVLIMLFVLVEFAPPQTFHYKNLKISNKQPVFLKGQVCETIEAQRGALDYSLKETPSMHFYRNGECRKKFCPKAEGLMHTRVLKKLH